jgi:hypothetical protein
MRIVITATENKSPSFAHTFEDNLIGERRCITDIGPVALFPAEVECNEPSFRKIRETLLEEP